MAIPNNLLEIGDSAIFSLSSCKPGYGVANLRDKSLETYWQSDGPQPHHINIEFLKKTTVDCICIYADYRLDESYTPNAVSIKAGIHFHDLNHIATLEIEEPAGWINIPLRTSQDKPVKAFVFQLSILANHLNGRDTHIRQVKLYEPKQPTKMAVAPFELFTADYRAYETLR